MALELNLNAIKALPAYQKALMGGILVVAVVALFFVFIAKPKIDAIKTLEQQIAQLNNDIQINQAKARRLDELKRENAELAHQLAVLKEQLPPESEIASLLKQVSDLGIKTGLDFKLWRPSERRPGASGLYTEIPVDVEVAGGYHAVAAFFDRIGKLPRIVNVSSLKMTNPKTDKGRLMIQTTFRATAFAAMDAATQPPPAAPPTGKKPGGQGA